MSGHILKCASEVRRLMPVFGLLFIALAGFCLTGVFAEPPISESDGTSPVAASLNGNIFTNGDSFKGLSLTSRRTGWLPDKSKIGFSVNGANKFNLNGVENRFGTLNSNQILFKR